MVPFGPTDESLLYELVVREGERPERPEDSRAAEVGLTDAMWSLMESSWASNPYQRPSASDVRDETVRFIGSPSFYVAGLGFPPEASHFHLHPRSYRIRPLIKTPAAEEAPKPKETADIRISEISVAETPAAAEASVSNSVLLPSVHVTHILITEGGKERREE